VDHAGRTHPSHMIRKRTGEGCPGDSLWPSEQLEWLNEGCSTPTIMRVRCQGFE